MRFDCTLWLNKAVFNRFPFVVIFEIHPEVIFILAVFHTSRNPGVWQQR